MIKIKLFLFSLFNYKISEKDILLRELDKKIINTKNYLELIELCREYNNLKKS